MTDLAPRVMVIEDDDAIRSGLCDVLSFGGFRPLECGRGDGAVQRVLEAAPDLVLLDVMLPGKNGFEILAELRAARPMLPIVMITARGSEADRVHGLNGGADDYVIKPFSAREVLARVGAVLRRSASRPLDIHFIRCGSGRVDLERREVRSGQVHACLSEREASFLRALAAGADRILTRDELLRTVWGVDPRGAETRAVDMQVVRLRETLAAHGMPDLVETVRGRGYRLSHEAVVER